MSRKEKILEICDAYQKEIDILKEQLANERGVLKALPLEKYPEIPYGKDLSKEAILALQAECAEIFKRNVVIIESNKKALAAATDYMVRLGLTKEEYQDINIGSRKKSKYNWVSAGWLKSLSKQIICTDYVYGERLRDFKYKTDRIEEDERKQKLAAFSMEKERREKEFEENRRRLIISLLIKYQMSPTDDMQDIAKKLTSMKDNVGASKDYEQILEYAEAWELDDECK